MATAVGEVNHGIFCRLFLWLLLGYILVYVLVRVSLFVVYHVPSIDPQPPSARYGAGQRAHLVVGGDGHRSGRHLDWRIERECLSFSNVVCVSVCLSAPVCPGRQAASNSPPLCLFRPCGVWCLVAGRTVFQFCIFLGILILILGSLEF